MYFAVPYSGYPCLARGFPLLPSVCSPATLGPDPGAALPHPSSSLLWPGRPAPRHPAPDLSAAPTGRPGPLLLCRTVVGRVGPAGGLKPAFPPTDQAGGHLQKGNRTRPERVLSPKALPPPPTFLGTGSDPAARDPLTWNRAGGPGRPPALEPGQPFLGGGVGPQACWSDRLWGPANPFTGMWALAARHELGSWRLDSRT